MSPALREVLVRRKFDPTGQELPPIAYVFGTEIGERVADIKTAWEGTVLRAHGHTPQRTRGRLSHNDRARLDEIDLHFHDLRHEAGSRKLEVGWPLHAVSVWLGHKDTTTTSRYLNADTEFLHELNDRKPLTLVQSSR